MLQYDFITVFITAGIRREQPGRAGTINIIVTSSEGMSDAALLETIMVATEAKAEALLALDLPLTGTPADAVMAACEGEERHRSAGRMTEAGKRVREAVLHGIPEALTRHDAGVQPIARHFSSSAGSRASTGSSGPRRTARIIPAISRGSPAISATARSIPAKTRASASGRRVRTAAGSGTVPAARSCTSRQLPSTLKKYPGASREELVRLYGKEKRTRSDNARAPTARHAFRSQDQYPRHDTRERD